MARQKDFIHFRADDSLLEALDVFVAQSPTSNRSAVIRTLLWSALRNEPQRAAALQALYDFSGVRKILVRRLIDEMDRQVPRIVREVMSDVRNQDAAE